MRSPTRPRWIPSWISPLLFLVLAGCSGKDAILPQDGPTMLEIYESHFGLPSSSGLSTPDDQLPVNRGQNIPGNPPDRPRSDWIQAGENNFTGFTRTAHDEIRSVFPVLPNPILILYVFPHLTAQGYPVPGYATSFPLYNRIEYALPGEVEGW